MFRVAWARHIADCLVQCNQHAVFFDGQSQKECVRDLLMAVDPVLKGFGEGDPTFLDGPVAKAGIVGEAFQHIGSLFQSPIAGRRISGNAKEARFGKRAQAPLKALGAKPSCYDRMVNVPRVEERDQNI